jgi:transposase InsO family protein
MQQIYTHSYFKKGELYNLSKLNSLINHPKYEEISKRLKIINFYDRYGLSATKEAYSVSRSTIYLWKKKVREADGDIRALAPQSKAPRKKRERKRNIVIEDFIIGYREEHPRAGKNTIKYELDKYCKDNKINIISESTIGRMIKDLKQRGILIDDVKVSFNGKTGKIRIIKKSNKKKERRNGYIPQRGGDLVQVDSITIFEEGIKKYIINGIDIKTRFGFLMMYDKLNSDNARDFMKRFQEVSPFKIKRIQTDNGSEFEKYFESYVSREGLKHYYNYPRHPQSNGCIERFNRTIKEQFVYNNLDVLSEREEFNKSMMKYLIWYNTRKAHRSLNNKPPLRYYLDEVINSSKKSNMLWTLTLI